MHTANRITLVIPHILDFPNDLEPEISTGRAVLNRPHGKIPEFPGSELHTYSSATRPGLIFFGLTACAYCGTRGEAIYGPREPVCISPGAGNPKAYLTGLFHKGAQLPGS